MSILDRFKGITEALNSPAARAFAITPNDDAELTTATRGLQVAVDGLLTADFLDEGDNIQVYCLAGIAYPYRVKKVYVTGTDATGIVGLY